MPRERCRSLLFFFPAPSTFSLLKFLGTWKSERLYAYPINVKRGKESSRDCSTDEWTREWKTSKEETNSWLKPSVRCFPWFSFPFSVSFLSPALSSDRRRDFETREGNRVERVPLFIILERLMNHGIESDVKPLVRYPLANQTPAFS